MSGCVSARSRRDTGVPMTRSSCRAKRESSAWNPDSSTMNGVASSARASRVTSRVQLGRKYRHDARRALAVARIPLLVERHVRRQGDRRRRAGERRAPVARARRRAACPRPAHAPTAPSPRSRSRSARRAARSPADHRVVRLAELAQQDRLRATVEHEVVHDERDEPLLRPPARSTRTRSSGPRDRANGSRTIRSSARSTSARVAPRRSTARPARAAPSCTTCTGSPPRSSNVVRSDSCRATTASTARCSASTSSAPLHARDDRCVIRRRLGRPLLRRPHGLLRERERRRATLGGAHDPLLGIRVARRRLDECRQRGDRAALEQIADRHACRQHARQTRHDTHREQRVAAEREEVVLDADLRHAEHLAPHLGDPCLGGVRGATGAGRSRAALDASGSGSARRSILPFGVSGSSRITTYCAGTM